MNFLTWRDCGDLRGQLLLCWMGLGLGFASVAGIRIIEGTLGVFVFLSVTLTLFCCPCISMTTLVEHNFAQSTQYSLLLMNML